MHSRMKSTRCIRLCPSLVSEAASDKFSGAGDLQDEGQEDHNGHVNLALHERTEGELCQLWQEAYRHCRPKPDD